MKYVLHITSSNYDDEEKRIYKLFLPNSFSNNNAKSEALDRILKSKVRKNLYIKLKKVINIQGMNFPLFEWRVEGEDRKKEQTPKRNSLSSNETIKKKNKMSLK